MKRKYYVFFILVFFLSTTGLSQTRKITGKVTTTDKAPLVGVTVLAKGLNIGSITDVDGNFSISVPLNAKTLIFRYIGMNPVELDIEDKKIVNVVMTEKNHDLTEVIVGALGIKRDAKAVAYSRQKLDPTSLSENPAPDIVGGLAGKIAGLNVTEGTTNTSSSRIVIRGSNSITGNNQPLFVVDGVPVESGSMDNQSITVGGGGDNLDYGSGTSQINPDNIANIEVLKGPNAAALYGSRAANGAIIITTKKADTSQKFKVSLSSNFQVQTVKEFPAYQNIYGGGNSSLLDASGSVIDAAGTQRIPHLSVFNTNWGAPMIGQLVYNLDNTTVTKYLPQSDNVSGFYQNAIQTNNTITLEGGNVANNYRFSYGNFYSNSIVDQMNVINRQTINATIITTFVKNLVLDSRVSYVNEVVKNRQYLNGNSRNPVYQYIFMMRNLNINDYRDFKDSYGNEKFTSRGFMNPFWAINENKNQDTKNRFNTSFNLTYTVNKNLSAVAKFGSEMQFLDGYEFDNMGAVTDLNGMMMTLNNKVNNYNLDAFLLYNKKDGIVTVNATAGISRSNQSIEYRSQRTDAVLTKDWSNIANTIDPYTDTQIITRKRINSLFGSANFGYNNYFFLDLTARNDWSSTLPPANNSYFYPSIGGSLLFSELFNINQNVLPLGKLRASYAIVGNDTKPYRLTNYYGMNGLFNNYPMSSLTTLFAEPDLKPEKTYSFEVGTELKFFSNRLGIDFTYYNNKTINQILTAILPASSGFNTKMYNAGEVRNNGVEIVFTAQPIKSKDFIWNTTINFAKNNSLVASLVNGMTSFKLQEWNTVGTYAEVGQPYGVLRGRGWALDSQGRRLVNADGTAMFTNDDIIGNASPNFTTSMINIFKYKSFDFSFLIDAKVGGSLYSVTQRKGDTQGAWASTLQGRNDYYLQNVIYGRGSTNDLQGGILIDGYFADGTKNNVYINPQIYYGSGAYSTIDLLSVYDASFVKLRQIAIGYTVPDNFVKKLKLTNIRLSLIGRNLWNIYQQTPRGIDPESSATTGNGQGIESGALPETANIGLNLNLSF